jgi:hypothetical protein
MRLSSLHRDQALPQVPPKISTCDADRVPGLDAACHILLHRLAILVQRKAITGLSALRIPGDQQLDFWSSVVLATLALAVAFFDFFNIFSPVYG